MYAKRVDANQKEIVEEFRRLGATVYVVNREFDLLVGYDGLNWLVEVKDGRKPPSKRVLTFNEQKFHDEWATPIYIIKSKEEVGLLLNPLKSA